MISYRTNIFRLRKLVREKAKLVKFNIMTVFDQ